MICKKNKDYRIAAEEEYYGNDRDHHCDCLLDYNDNDDYNCKKDNNNKNTRMTAKMTNCTFFGRLQQEQRLQKSR